MKPGLELELELELGSLDRRGDRGEGRKPRNEGGSRWESLPSTLLIQA